MTGALVLAALATACAGWSGPVVHTAPAPSDAERYCAWYGDARDEVLYFGQAAFWSAFRAKGGDPLADMDAPGPQLIGRFDLRAEKLLEPLEVGGPDGPTGQGGRAGLWRSGVWDVLAHPNGRIYFTTYFEAGGYVDPATGRVERLTELGPGLNELALGPDGSILVSRYGDAMRGGGVVVMDADGKALAEYPLPAPAGYSVAPKTVAFDRRRGTIWVTTDLLAADGGPDRHDAYVLDADGGETLRRIERPEIQFVAAADDGTLFRAEVEGTLLYLRTVPADGSRQRVQLLAPDFPGELDFVQDVHVAADGRAVVTRWSGWIHVVDPSGRVRSSRLPTPEPGGLYYTAVLARRGRVCSTYCADVTVVCSDAP